MFENNGAPTGYNQIQPGLDQPRQTPPGRPGRPPSAATPLQNAIVNPVAPAYPTDQGFLQWRQATRPGQIGQQGTQQPMAGGLGSMGEPGGFAGAPAPQQISVQPTSFLQGDSMMGGGAPLGKAPQQAPQFGNTGTIFHPGVPAGQPQFGTMPQAQPAQAQASFGNLSDPHAWMSLVGNQDQLRQFVSQGLGAAAQRKPDLVDYYMKKIQGQPGANAQEQAGSAQYWMDKMQQDPNVTGRPAPGQQRPMPRFNAGMDPNSMNPALMQAVLYGQNQQPSNYLQQMMQVPQS